mgnify:CR=1 FL=1
MSVIQTKAIFLLGDLIIFLYFLMGLIGNILAENFPVNLL